MADVDRLTEYAQQLLEVCAAALEITDAGPPVMQGVVPVGPAFDCEQLTVEVISIGDAPFAGTSSFATGGKITAAINLPGFRVKIIRCVHVIAEDGTPPTMAQQSEDAAKVNQDAWAIWTGVRTAQKNGELFGGECDHLLYDGATGIEAEGGMAGWQIDFRAELAGFLNETSGS